MHSQTVRNREGTHGYSVTKWRRQVIKPDEEREVSQTYYSIIVQIAMLNRYFTVCSARDLIGVLDSYIGALVGMHLSL